MSIISFGAGTLWGVRTDISNASPIKFGALQGVDVGFSASTKELYGSNQFPLAVARGTGKIECKAKMGIIQGGVFSDLFFGVSQAAGQLGFIDGEAGTIASGAGLLITVANSAQWVDDLGVIFTATGMPLTKVADTPATGQYSVAVGVYTFASADIPKAVKISYSYTIVGTGKKLVVPNPILGVQPVFSVYLKTNYTAPSGVKYTYLKLNACVSSKLSLPTKMEDFSIVEFDFSAFADDSGNLFTFSNNEGS